METLNAIILALMPAIIGAAGYVAFKIEKWFKAKTKLELEAYHREALHSALTTGSQLVLARIRGDAAAEGAAKAAILREVVDYAQRSVPDAISYLGAAFDHLLDMAEAKFAVESATLMFVEEKQLLS